MSTIRLCAYDELVPGSARRFDVEGHRIAVVRIVDDLYAIGDTCSHAEVSLSEGTVWADDCELECWKHGATFSLRTGEPQSLPATQPVPVFEIRRDGADVLVVLP
jgi:3-phenylpropionate/trans-cinnamate dioxygenase ferredoxin subunit